MIELILDILVYKSGRFLRWLYYRGEIKYKDLDDLDLDWFIGSIFLLLVSLIIIFFLEVF